MLQKLVPLKNWHSYGVYLVVCVTDVGALFSGADIVQWMLDNLAGLNTSEEAEKLGQLLLDQNTILHSEGSR